MSARNNRVAGGSAPVQSRGPAFTLIEMLIVVAIVSLLMTLLLPTLGQAREQARRTVCASNLRQVGVGIYNYWTVWNGRVPYVETPMTNAGFGAIAMFGSTVVADELVDPFDRTRWSLSLPNVLAPTHMAADERVFTCPSAVNGWPRQSDGVRRCAYRDAGANQPNGVATDPNSYDRESFGFLDGRVLTRFRLDLVADPKNPMDIIANAQKLAEMRGTYLRDLVEFRQVGDAVVGPHKGGIMCLDRDMQVRYRDQKTAADDLAPNGAGVRF